MQQVSSAIEPYIDRSYYNEALQTLRAENGKGELIGRRNPYTGKIILSDADADSYLQQQALSVTYKAAAERALAGQRGAYEGQISVYQEQITALKKQHRRPALAILLIVAAFFIGTRFSSGSVPDRSISSSQSNATTYTQPTKAPGAAVLVTAKPTSKPIAKPSTKPTAKPTVKPNPTATPKPKAAAYKTTPVSWVELTRTVYVSRNGKIHLRDNCSGMKYSTVMTYEEACEKGYVHCKKCF